MSEQAISEHLLAAKLSGEHARQEFAQVVSTCIGFGVMTLVGREASQRLIPNGEFKDSIHDFITKSGSIVTAATAVGGAVSSLRWKVDAMRHRSIARSIQTTADHNQA